MNQKDSQQHTVVWNAPPQNEYEVMDHLRESPFLYGSYQRLNQEWKQRFLDFCQGKKSLPLTYDPFFKRIFHPDIHPDRLSRLVSSLLGIKVKIVRILSSEDSILAGDTLLIMDMLGELEDGSLVNIEIQKQSYAFPAERVSCYSSDLIMRQYARIKGLKGSAFTYRDIKKGYVIVIFEQSAKEFHEIPDRYIHHGKNTFDTGLKLELLQECYLVALDVFKKFPYPKDRSEQTAWLSLLATEDLEDAERLILHYPWLEDIYAEIAMLRQKPEEVLGMFSEALRILDQNTVHFMIDEMKKEIAEKDARLNEQKSVLNEQKALLDEQKSTISQKDAEIQALRKQLRESAQP